MIYYKHLLVLVRSITVSQGLLAIQTSGRRALRTSLLRRPLIIPLQHWLATFIAVQPGRIELHSLVFPVAEVGNLQASTHTKQDVMHTFAGKLRPSGFSS